MGGAGDPPAPPTERATSGTCYQEQQEQQEQLPPPQVLLAPGESVIVDRPNSTVEPRRDENLSMWFLLGEQRFPL